MGNSRFFINSGIYVVVSILQKAISFFLLPLYTAFLTPADYGTLNVVLSLSSLLSVFFILSLNSAGARFYYKHLDDEQYIKKLWGALSLFVLLNSIVLGFVFILFHKLLINPFISDIDFYPLMFLGILNTIVTPLYSFYQTYLQTKQSGFRFGLNLMLNFLLNVSLIIIFVVVYKKGVLGILLANVITSSVFLVYVLLAFIPKIKLSLDSNILKPAFKYSLPLVPHSLSSWVMVMIDRVFLNNITGKTETGLYSVGYQFGNIISVINTAINQAYAPWFFEKEKKDELNQVVKVAELLTVIYCFLALGISLYSKDILIFMVSPGFRSAWHFIPFISFAYVFSGLYYFFVNVLFLKQTKWVPIITFSSAIAGLVLNIILINSIGSIGASISCFITLLLSSLISLLFSLKAHSMRFKYIRMYLYVFLFFILSLSIFIPHSLNQILFLIIKTLFFLILFGIFFLLYKKEIIYLKSIISNKFIKHNN